MSLIYETVPVVPSLRAECGPCQIIVVDEMAVVDLKKTDPMVKMPETT